MTSVADKRKTNQEFLEKLNHKIAAEKSPDFTIGHSDFMRKNGSVTPLADILNKKVIPLLLEYFMNDLDQVEHLLKSVGIATERVNYGILKYIEKIPQLTENE